MVSLAEIGRWRNENPHATHEEIAREFENWVETNLGYSLHDRTLRLNEAKELGIPDLQGKDENEKTIVVFELKTDSDEIWKLSNRSRFEGDQLTRYLCDNTIDPSYIILTDGLRLYFYENLDRKLTTNKTLWIDDLSQESSLIERKLIQLCKKPELDYINKDAIEEYLVFLRKHPNYLDTKKGIEFFAAKFALNRNTFFGKLVESTIALMHYLHGKSQFFDGAYEFWSLTFYNKPEKIPTSWKSFLLSISAW